MTILFSDRNHLLFPPREQPEARGFLTRFLSDCIFYLRSQVMGMDGDNESSEIVRAIATLAHNLGMYVTAEGVEKEEHLVQLWSLHCDYGQGYFFSPGLDRVAAQKLLEKSPRW